MGITINHTKITLLKEEIVRFEFAKNDNFTNLKTIFTDKKKISTDKIDFVNNENDILFKYLGYEFHIDKDGSLSSIRVYKDDQLIYKYKGKMNCGELPKREKTPFIFDVIDSPRIIVDDGFYIEDNPNFTFEKENKDLFLLICNQDFKKLRAQYISLTGHNEMPKFVNLGVWHSRYHAYSQKELLDVVNKYKKHNIPLDNLVIDTDWRYHDSGTGYELNTSLFPDLKAFFSYTHDQKIETLFNDHPVPFNKSTTPISDEEYTFRSNNLVHYLEMGLDSWWFDRNWMYHLNTPTKKITLETLGTYIYHYIEEKFYKSLTIDQQVYIRPTTLSNVNNIACGDYKKIMDTTCHRYAFQWTGDIPSSLYDIKVEISNMIKCSNNMIAHYSSDLGGHFGNPNKDEYIRWIQYGAFSPFYRPHCTCDVIKSREPWNYDKKTLDITRNYIQMRYRLLNVFYTASYKNYSQGLGIIKPLNFVFDPNTKINKIDDEYILGDDILVHPVTSNEFKLVSKNYFISPINVYFYDNMELNGKPFKNSRINVINIEKLCKKPVNCRIRTKISFNRNVNLSLLLNSFADIYLDNKLVCQKTNENFELLTINKLKAHKEYKLTIDFATKKKPLLKLLYTPAKKKQKTKVFLPEGEWFDVSNRNVYKGNRNIKKLYPISNMPLFVKAGALIPLYKNVSKASNMSLKDIVYDYYGSKNIINENYFYEDDGYTTAYQYGVNRINPYRTEFIDNSYVLTLLPSKNNLDDNIKTRNALVKLHVRDGDYVESVSINDEPIRFKRHDHRRKEVPFSNTEFSKDSKTVALKFKQDIKEKYVIKFVLRTK